MHSIASCVGWGCVCHQRRRNCLALATGPLAVTAYHSQSCGAGSSLVVLQLLICSSFVPLMCGRWQVWQMASMTRVVVCVRGVAADAASDIHAGHSTQAVDVKSLHLGPLPGCVLLPAPALRAAPYVAQGHHEGTHLGLFCCLWLCRTFLSCEKVSRLRCC